MKKVIGIFLVMVFVFVIITANAEQQNSIFNDVYDFWKDLHGSLIEIYDDHYINDEQEFVYDGYYYVAGLKLSFGEEIKEMSSYKEIENYIEETYRNHGIKHVKCNIVRIGQDNNGHNVLYVEINTMTNLREIEDYADFESLEDDDGSNVYGCRIIFYDYTND